MSECSISKTVISSFRLPLRVPLRISGKDVLSRDGLLIEFYTGAGLYGVGEISPLPGLHDESLQDAHRQVENWTDTFRGRTVSAGLSACGQAEGIYPSVRFGVESALLQLAAQEEGKTVGAYLGGDAKDRVKVNALITEADKLDAACHRIQEGGFSSVKVKVGRDPSLDASRVLAVVARLEKIDIRLDANQRWSMNDAVTFWDRIPDGYVTYVEEPLRDATSLADLHDKTGMPIALDESLSEERVDRLSRVGALAAVVLKPSVLGGIEACKPYLCDDRYTPVFSAAFESGVGISQIGDYAAAYTRSPSGLDTYQMLAADVLSSRLAFEGGDMLLSPPHREDAINRKMLRTLEDGEDILSAMGSG